MNSEVRPLQRAVAEGGRHGDKGQHHQREILARAQRSAPASRHAAPETPAQASRAGPPRNDPMAAVASAGPPRPARAILLPSSAVTIDALSPGVFSRIEVVDPPYMPAVIDAREHDQRPRRVKPVGHRQQQRHGQRRADAGQHADGGAKRHADQRVKQDHRVQRGRQGPAAGSRKVVIVSPRRSGFPAARPAGSASEAGRKRHRPPSAKPMPTGKVQPQRFRLPNAARGAGEQQRPTRWKSPRACSRTSCSAKPAEDQQHRRRSLLARRAASRPAQALADIAARPAATGTIAHEPRHVAGPDAGIAALVWDQPGACQISSAPSARQARPR